MFALICFNFVVFVWNELNIVSIIVEPEVEVELKLNATCDPPSEKKPTKRDHNRTQLHEKCQPSSKQIRIISQRTGRSSFWQSVLSLKIAQMHTSLDLLFRRTRRWFSRTTRCVQHFTLLQIYLPYYLTLLTCIFIVSSYYRCLNRPPLWGTDSLPTKTPKTFSEIVMPLRLL